MALLSDLHPTGRRGIFFREHSTRKHGLRKDRQLVLRYTIGGRTHTEIFGWVSDGRSEAEAELKISEFRTNHKSGAGPVSLTEERVSEESQRAANKERIRREEEKNITVANFFENVYYPHAKEEKKPDTYETEERLFRLWIKPVIGTLPFAEIAPFHLDKIKANMRKGKREDTYKNSKPRPLSPKSIMHALALIRQIWNHARRDGIVSGDWPGRDVKKPKFDNRRVRFLDKVEAGLLLDELKKTSIDLHDMALISLHCGLRAGEECRHFH
jgi:hypothetical protein